MALIPSTDNVEPHKAEAEWAQNQLGDSCTDVFLVHQFLTIFTISVSRQ